MYRDDARRVGINLPLPPTNRRATGKATPNRHRMRQLAPVHVLAHMRRMTVPPTRTLALATALAAALALAIAQAAEHWLEFAPCALCLWERWPYRVIILLGLIAVVLPRGGARSVLWVVVLIALAETALAALHLGVEQHLWPSPLPECIAPRFTGGNIADMLKAMPAHVAKPCDSPSYLLPFLPVSMVAMNLLYAAAFTLALAGTLWCTRRHST
jgi:disulfide bond formation protein DsbB